MVDHIGRPNQPVNLNNWTTLQTKNPADLSDLFDPSI